MSRSANLLSHTNVAAVNTVFSSSVVGGPQFATGGFGQSSALSLSRLRLRCAGCQRDCFEECRWRQNCCGQFCASPAHGADFLTTTRTCIRAVAREVSEASMELPVNPLQRHCWQRTFAEDRNGVSLRLRAEMKMFVLSPVFRVMLLGIAAGAIAASVAAAEPRDPASWVNPLIGTANGGNVSPAGRAFTGRDLLNGPSFDGYASYRDAWGSLVPGE